MPLQLDDPAQVTISTVKIVSFSCLVEPLFCTVNYVRGYDSPGGWVTIDGGTAQYDAAAIATVDPDGTIYTLMKDALYELLETTVGAGIID
jgi:hypothetical protein